MKVALIAAAMAALASPVLAQAPSVYDGSPPPDALLIDRGEMLLGGEGRGRTLVLVPGARLADDQQVEDSQPQSLQSFVGSLSEVDLIAPGAVRAPPISPRGLEGCLTGASGLVQPLLCTQTGAVLIPAAVDSQPAAAEQAAVQDEPQLQRSVQPPFGAGRTIVLKKADGSPDVVISETPLPDSLGREPYRQGGAQLFEREDMLPDPSLTPEQLLISGQEMLLMQGPPPVMAARSEFLELESIPRDEVWKTLPPEFPQNGFGDAGGEPGPPP